MTYISETTSRHTFLGLPRCVGIRYITRHNRLTIRIQAGGSTIYLLEILKNKTFKTRKLLQECRV